MQSTSSLLTSTILFVNSTRFDKIHWSGERIGFNRARIIADIGGTYTLGLGWKNLMNLSGISRALAEREAALTLPRGFLWWNVESARLLQRLWRSAFSPWAEPRLRYHPPPTPQPPHLSFRGFINRIVDSRLYSDSQGASVMRSWRYYFCQRSFFAQESHLPSPRHLFAYYERPKSYSRSTRGPIQKPSSGLISSLLQRSSRRYQDSWLLGKLQSRWRGLEF